MTVEKNQMYRACNPLDEGRTLRVLGVAEVASGFAWVASVDGPPRERWINIKQLHASAMTRSGQPRRSGYALVEE